MKQPTGSPNKSSSTTPPIAKDTPLKTQTGAAANRDKVREVLPVHAPRQSKVPVERSK